MVRRCCRNLHPLTEGREPSWFRDRGGPIYDDRTLVSIRTGIVPTGGEFGSITAGGSWLYRVAATRNRALSFYCGGGAFLGVDFDEVNGAVKEVISDSESDSSATWAQGEDSTASHSAFTYGLEPVAEMELFFTRKAALIAGVSIPVRLLTRQENLSLRASAGIRINF